MDNGCCSGALDKGELMGMKTPGIDNYIFDSFISQRKGINYEAKRDTILIWGYFGRNRP